MAGRALLSFLLLAAVVAAVQADKEKLFKKYGMMKIYDSCFGKDLNKQYLRKMKDAAMRCKSMPMMSHSVVGGASFGSSGFGSSSSVFAPPRSGSQNQQEALQAFIKQFQQAAQNGQNPNAVFIPFILNSDQARRAKRQANNEKYFDADMIRKLSMKMKAKISNMTCVLREQGYLDGSNELQYSNMISEIRSMNIDYELRQDLIEGVEDCRDFVQCMPLDQRKMGFPVAVKRIKMFLKCSTKQKLMACMKKDLRMKTDQFDLSGLGDLMEGADDDEKMLAILWAKSALGGDYDF